MITTGIREAGRYHNKGDKNHDKPKYYGGIKFNEGFITMQGSGDMCSDCCTKHNVINQLIDYILDKDLKIEIQKNDYRDSKYLKDKIQICYKCEHEMTESEMGKSSTMMGDGYYPSTCPKCGTESKVFGSSHKTTNKFKHRVNPLSVGEIQNIKREIKLHNESLEDIKKKINLFKSKRNENVFIIREDEFNNGHRTVLKINTVKKVYHVGYFWKDKVSKLVDYLSGYEETENEYVDFE